MYYVLTVTDARQHENEDISDTRTGDGVANVPDCKSGMPWVRVPPRAPENPRLGLTHVGDVVFLKHE